MRRVCILVVITLVACAGGGGGGEEPPESGVASPRRATLVTVVDSFATPESAIFDAELDVWFVTNINGNPSAKDNNGFISRIGPDGAIQELRFIEGGASGVTLHAPKGTALQGDTLWVADIDVVRGFNKRTGVTVETVDLSGQAHFLNDIAVHPDGALYVTDTGIEFDANGEMSHPGPDQIFRVFGGQAHVALVDERLQSPNGIVWDEAYKRFFIVPFGGADLFRWGPAFGLSPVGEGPGGQDGVVALPGGMLLVSSWADSSLFLFGADRVRTPLITNVPSPADFGYDSSRSRVAIPLFQHNQVQIWTIPPTG